MMVYESLAFALHEGWMIEANVVNGYRLRRASLNGWEYGLVDLTIRLNGHAAAAD